MMIMVLCLVIYSIAELEIEKLIEEKLPTEKGSIKIPPLDLYPCKVILYGHMDFGFGHVNL